ncbi:MAG: 50S ribosomal protein L9 [Gemmatimonadota bacterium]|jgi:large subunit ribosomal protein L9|nr:50S ribosomal protein L9 [Gemmatimonadota bacterium]MDQ3605682.1 50S ribosomal protein L9 [Gemmatimonadota bacterium]
MQVILRERLENLGDAGEVVDVKPGYARNYLIPQGLAYEASVGNVRRIENERAVVQRQAADQLAAARARVGEIEAISLTFNARAAQEGRLFGSITTADIADRLATQGVEVDRRQIELEEPIKSLGVFSVPIRLHSEIRPEIKIWVIKEE